MENPEQLWLPGEPLPDGRLARHGHAGQGTLQLGRRRGGAGTDGGYPSTTSSFGASIYDEKIFSPILVCISFFTHVFTTHNILKKLAKNNDANARKKCVKPYTEFDPAWQGSLPTHCHSASYRKILGQRREFLYFLLPKVDMHVNKQVLELL